MRSAFVDAFKILKLFKEGYYNTLVSTSIGEEGLDIGEVDRIICYDSQKTPIRMVKSFVPNLEFDISLNTLLSFSVSGERVGSETALLMFC